MKPCPVCAHSMSFVFNEVVLGKYDVAFFHCQDCGLLQTEDQYWVKEAYSDAIASADTGLIRRNLSIASKLTAILFFVLRPNGACIDIAGGYGMLVRLMRDIGFDFYWSDKYCKNLLARGFEDDRVDGKVHVMSAFEVLEHVADPVLFIKDAMTRYSCNTLVFSTQTFEGGVPDKSWWYYSFATGQHISFYQPKTLVVIADKLGINFYSGRGVFIFTDRKINRFKLSLTTGLMCFPLAIYASIRMSSKTVADNHLMASAYFKPGH